jgi:hypothetical protein
MNTQKHPQTFWKPQEKKIFFFIAWERSLVKY